MSIVAVDLAFDGIAEESAPCPCCGTISVEDLESIFDGTYAGDASTGCPICGCQAITTDTIDDIYNEVMS